MTIGDSAWLVGAGFIAGAMNALVGGGSFVSLPALVSVGYSAFEANASSSVALYPGGVVSAFVYRGGARQVCGIPVNRLMAVSVVGGCAGALILLWTPTTLFDRVLPWLLLIATVALAFGGRLNQLRGTARHGPRLVVFVQFVLGLYAGYFGGAVGLLMMAAWRLLGEDDIKVLNRPRTLLVTAANTAAIALLAAAGVVRWAASLPVGVGALAGGYAGARLGTRLSPRIVRVMTIVISTGITIAFFVRSYRR